MSNRVELETLIDPWPIKRSILNEENKRQGYISGVTSPMIIFVFNFLRNRGLLE